MSFWPVESQLGEVPLTPMLSNAAAQASQSPPVTAVGTVLLRRIKYAARLLYWAQYHCSFSLARWICAYEGKTW